MKRLSTLVIGAAILTLGITLLGPSSLVSADGGHVIDDSVFNYTGSMSASQIDAFLNEQASSCISKNNGFSTPDPQGFSDSQGKYTFGGSVSAGQAISDIATHYDVNPQVVIAEMQKEQSIPTGVDGCHYDKPNPSDASQLYTCTIAGKTGNCTDACPYSYGGGCMNIAMSYDCPGSCWAAAEGFGTQLSGGTWALRWAEERAYGILTGYPGYDSGDEYYTYYGPLTAGQRQRVAGGPVIDSDGTWTDNNGTSVTIANGSTASLYSYTPFVSDTKFQDIFNSWFGSTFGVPYTWKQVSKGLFTDSSKTVGLSEDSIKRGQSFYVEIRALNTGNTTWTKGVYGQQVNVGTSNPDDRSSAFCDVDWLSRTGCGRTATTLENTVAPGQVGTFDFWMTAPTQPGVYNEYFNLVADGSSWLHDIGFYWKFTVGDSFSTSGDAQPYSSLTLGGKQYLRRDERLVSPDGRTVLIFKPEGHLQIYGNYGSTWTLNAPYARLLQLQNDGNLVLYNDSGQAVWASNTSNGTRLTLQNDGNLVLYNSSNQVVWSSSSSTPSSATATTWAMAPGSIMYRGQILKSQDGRYTLALQRDGNLVLYSPTRALWATNTGKGFLLVQQSDGNLVLYSPTGQAIWGSGTSGTIKTYLQVDGNLVSYNQNGTPVWATNTVDR